MAFFIDMGQSPRSRLAEQIGLGAGKFIERRGQEQQAQKQQSALANALGFGDSEQFSQLPVEAQLALAKIENEKQKNLSQMLQQSKKEEFDKEQSEILADYAEGKEVSPERRRKLSSQNQLAAMRFTNKAPAGGITGQPVPQEISQKIPEILNENKKSTADELALAFDQSGVPRIFSNSYIESRRRQEETSAKGEQAISKEIRKEVAPIKKEIASRAQSARLGIENKQKLLNLIDTNNLDDPTFATIAYAVPLNLGKRLLSPETVEYKAGLIEEFGDLRKLFQGQTRIKEIDLLEDKLADVYLTDEQKKRILKSRINSLKADIIREKAAAKVEQEYPNLGVLQFQRKVEEIAKPKLEKLFNSILDEHKFIIDQAEKRKELPLNPEDPEDLVIMQSLLREAGGDKKRAWELAKKKGYIFQ